VDENRPHAVTGLALAVVLHVPSLGWGMERVVLSYQAMSRACRWTLKVQACNEMLR
jgi:hypothetical protein